MPAAALCTLGSVTVPSLASVFNEFALKKHMDTSVHEQVGRCYTVLAQDCCLKVTSSAKTTDLPLPGQLADNLGKDDTPIMMPFCMSMGSLPQTLCHPYYARIRDELFVPRAELFPLLFWHSVQPAGRVCSHGKVAPVLGRRVPGAFQGASFASRLCSGTLSTPQPKGNG